MKPNIDRSRLAAYLAALDVKIDQPLNLPADTLQFQGYHTTVPNGTRVHWTNLAFDYALALFAEGSEESVEKGSGILRKTLALQNLSPCSSSFGVWPWFFEEPLEDMRPPDFNWADFCGMRIAHILLLYGDKLDAALRREAIHALHCAAWSIFRRNMDPSYTNIAVKGGVVAALAGEIIGVDLLLTYGRERLCNFVAYTRQNGGFGEYNSPNYGVFVLEIAERGLLLIRDEETREHLSAIHRMFWEMLDVSLHLPTGQICGPHSRSYANLLKSDQRCMIQEGLGETLFKPESEQVDKPDALGAILIPRVPCPPEIRNAILARGTQSADEQFRRVTFIRAAADANGLWGDRTGAFWSRGPACLGSVNYDNLWQQRRPLIGYWRTGNFVTVLRVRLRHALTDFASGVLHTTQQGSAALCYCSLATNLGDSHQFLDRPKNGVFRMSDLALSIELDAPDAVAEVKPDGLYELREGDYRVEIRPLAGRFGPYQVEWQINRTETGACVKASIGEGKPLNIQPDIMRDVGMGFSLKLLRSDEKTCGLPPVSRIEGETIILSDFSSGCSLELRAPRHPCPLP